MHQEQYEGKPIHSGAGGRFPRADPAGGNSSSKLASDDSDFNATPVLAGRQLFLRSNRTLDCVGSMQTAGAGHTR